MITINGSSYEEFNEIYWAAKADETKDEYEKRYIDFSSKITHWLCNESEVLLDVTEGKVYETTMAGEGQDRDIFIIDDSGSLSSVWLMLEGTFLIKPA